jgi:hypothetical protein
MSFWSTISFAHAPSYYLTFIRFALFDLINRRFLKKFDLYQLFCFDRFLPLFAFASWSLSFHVLLITELLREVATVANVLISVVLELKLNQKWIYYLAYTNVANENCVKFCMKKFSSVGKGEWWDEKKYGKKLKLGDAHVTLRNIQKVQASKLGDAPRHPLLHQQKYEVIF